VTESAQLSDTLLSKTATTLAPVHKHSVFTRVLFYSAPPAGAGKQADIRIEFQHGATAVHIH
jgi:hypothetical protein